MSMARNSLLFLDAVSQHIGDKVRMLDKHRWASAATMKNSMKGKKSYSPIRW